MNEKNIKNQHYAQAINKDNLEHASGGWDSGQGYSFNNDKIEKLTDARYTVIAIAREYTPWGAWVAKCILCTKCKQ